MDGCEKFQAVELCWGWGRGQSGRQEVLLRDEGPSLRKCCAVVKGALELSRATFASWLCIFLAIGTCSNSLTSICLSRLICKMETIALYLKGYYGC